MPLCNVRAEVTIPKMPHLYHYIAIKDKATGNTTYEKHYKGSQRTGDRGEEYWSTYRWQLESFVDKLRGRTPTHWVTNESTIDQMKTIDMIYEKVSRDSDLHNPLILQFS